MNKKEKQDLIMNHLTSMKHEVGTRRGRKKLAAVMVMPIIGSRNVNGNKYKVGNECDSCALNITVDCEKVRKSVKWGNCYVPEGTLYVDEGKEV
jgi:hypothetical protein